MLTRHSIGVALTRIGVDWKIVGDPFSVRMMRAATAPLVEASASIVAGDVQSGLAALSRENLGSALSRGIAETATFAGAAMERLRARLPSSEIDETLARVGELQTAALETWNRHEARVSGFLRGVGVVSLRPPAENGAAVGRDACDASLLLSGLARTLVRDTSLAVPLERLAVAIAEWRDLVARCADALAADDGLRASYVRKRALRVLTAALVVGAVIAGAWIQLDRLASRRRVDAALAHPDPCAAEAIPARDLDRASDEGRRAHAARLVECEAARARAAEEAARRALAARVEAGCDALAARVESDGRLGPEDEGLLGPKAALARRVAAGALKPADLAITEADVEWGCPHQARRLWLAAARAAARSGEAWAKAERVSAALKTALLAEKIGLSETAETALSLRSDTIAKSALFGGDPATVATAKDLCEVQTTLSPHPAGWCKALLATLGRTAQPR